MEWIKTTDKLPEENHEVIVCGNGFTGNKIVTTMEYKEGRWWSDIIGDFVKDDRITHWMNLPEPPTN